MNKTRRKALEKINAQIEDIVAGIEMLRDEEQEYIDNMPEGLQGSDKAEMAEDAVSSMESALESLAGAANSIDEAAAGDQ